MSFPSEQTFETSRLASVLNGLLWHKQTTLGLPLAVGPQPKLAARDNMVSMTGACGQLLAKEHLDHG
jgi:hypothetical protein